MDVREIQRSRGTSIIAQVSVTTRKTWMPSPDPSLSLIESGYESDLSCRGRDWVFVTLCESVMLLEASNPIA